MKNVLISFLALCCLFSAPAAAHEYADDEPLIVRSQLIEGGLKVLVANLEQETATITLTSIDRRERVFNDRISKHNGYSYSLNLDQLRHGRYILAVKKGDTLRQQVILVGETGVMCSDWK
jgi:hypothetical protein